MPHFPNVRKCEFRFFRPKAAAAALKAVSDVVALCPLLREVAYHVYTETEALVAHESELLQGRSIYLHIVQADSCYCAD